MRKLEFYGGNLEALKSREKEVCLVGPAGSGKSLTLCMKMHYFASKYPGIKILLTRKCLPSLRNTTVKTYETVLDYTGCSNMVRVLGESRPTEFL